MNSINYTEFKGKVVFVTGVASGIGKEQACLFLEQGAYVFGFDKEEIEKQYSESFTFFKGDVTKKDDLEQAVSECLAKYRKIDILLNTAGKLDEFKPLNEISEELWDVIYETNVKSYFRLTKLILPMMLKQQGGTIINMASIAGLIGGGGGVSYTMSKHAVVGFTKQLALDYAEQGIHVVGIAPGAIKTPMNAADFSGDGHMAKWVADETPCKRWASPEEVAQLTLFLASQASSYIQGSIVPIDGGWMTK
ncbi:3-oxoacyl-ACP reductase [Vagococcus teuberi]|uniref:3-oxoacyl-ACP reductase n=1 Tax=Vagococcus teuberi TaxID=519472 RepID=A0A1J0A7P9_9ENTE|nr:MULTISPECIES: 3-oxoacyl-ACP reductase [Vagococcus]APB31955.1 3-oxoacyl-ACP reductase [Vagococcus teuberi]RHH70132.1 3-oxoacyl-ACP reductase [Vagococcus sp. AM17-17]